MRCQLKGGSKNEKINKKTKSSGNRNLSQQIKSNNNEEDYENGYPSSPVEDGRVSGGSEESAFSSNSIIDSSTSSLTSHSDLHDSSLSPSSGRSSADNRTDESLDARKTLSPHCNLTPETLEYLEIIERVRVTLLSLLQEEKGGDEEDQCEEIDPQDLEQIQQPLTKQNNHEQQLVFRLISRYVNYHTLAAKQSSQESIEKEVGEAAIKLKDLLKFRHQNQLNTLRDDSFIKEFYQLSGIFQFGLDKNQIPVLYLRARIHRKWSTKMDEAFKRFVAYKVNQLTKSYAGPQASKAVDANQNDKDGSFVICFDCLHVSYSCMDMDFLRYLVQLLVQYFPSYCRYALCVDLPWLFRSVWKLVQTWLPEEARNSVHLITAEQLVDFIDADQIPNSMKINDLTASEKPKELKHKYPENIDQFRSIEDLAREINLSTSEVKQFKKHLGAVIKEYESLGAV